MIHSNDKCRAANFWQQYFVDNVYSGVSNKRVGWNKPTGGENGQSLQFLEMKKKCLEET